MQLIPLTRLSHRLPPSRWVIRCGRALATVSSRVRISPVGFVEMKDGTRMLLDLRSRTEGEAAWTGRYDDALIRLLRQLCPPDGVLLDVGANVGLISVPMARHLRPMGGLVIAIEPLNENVDRLLASAAANDVDIACYDVAVGAEPGTLTLLRESSLGSVSGNAVPEAVADKQHRTAVRRLVPVTTLDLLVERSSISRIDLIKIDIEGGDFDFLIGAESSISRWRPPIWGEFHADFMPRLGRDFLDVSRWADEHGYIVCRPMNGRLICVPIVARMGDVLLWPVERALPPP